MLLYQGDANQGSRMEPQDSLGLSRLLPDAESAFIDQLERRFLPGEDARAIRGT